MEPIRKPIKEVWGLTSFNLSKSIFRELFKVINGFSSDLIPIVAFNS